MDGVEHRTKLLTSSQQFAEIRSGFGSNPILYGDRGMNRDYVWTLENVGGLGIEADSTYQTVGGEAVGSS